MRMAFLSIEFYISDEQVALPPHVPEAPVTSLARADTGAGSQPPASLPVTVKLLVG